jgi:hypothetical protein
MKGISKRTTSLGFNILRLHYTADPDKDPATPAGKLWYDEARKGISDARWRQEHEIDYGALGGQLVFPEFEPSAHVVPAFDLNPEFWTTWMACDPHPRAPHAFLWLSVNRIGEMVVSFSWWEENTGTEKKRLTVKDYAAWIKKVEETKGFKRPYRVMDVAGKSFNATEEHSYFDAYREEGIYFQPGKKNRDMSGFELINEALRLKPYSVGNGEELRPKLTFMGDGANDELVYQISHLRFAEFRGNVVDKEDPQMPVEKRRHLVDALCYILLDQPRFIDLSRPVEQYDGVGRVVTSAR